MGQPVSYMGMFGNLMWAGLLRVRWASLQSSPTAPLSPTGWAFVPNGLAHNDKHAGPFSLMGWSDMFNGLDHLENWVVLF